MRISDWSSDVCSSDLIPAADRSTQAGKWEKSRFMGMELTGKTLGVIGCGNIGAIVADRAQGLKMHVIAYDPFLSPDRARDLNVEKVELDALLARADVIPLHVPMTDQARGMIDAKALAKTKRSEENTSELKSLMRSSYAVFCLKK